jgi:hypothetical protein
MTLIRGPTTDLHLLVLFRHTTAQYFILWSIVTYPPTVRYIHARTTTTTRILNSNTTLLLYAAVVTVTDMLALFIFKISP